MTDRDFDRFMAKTASYIEAVQPALDKYNEERDLFVKRATQAAGVLAHRGVIDRANVNTLVDKVAESPSAVWDIVEKMAASLGADSLGSPAHEQVVSHTADPWEREFLGGGSAGNGMVD